METACVILAAGLGKRMKSDLPKVLHPVCGVPMLQNVVDTTRKLKLKKIVVVAGKHMDLIKKVLADDAILFASQENPQGTAHALRCALPTLGNFKGVLLVLNGDTPLVSFATIRKFLNRHVKDRNAVSVLSFNAGNPTGYGRIVRDGRNKFVSIVEEKNADVRQKQISEVNSGVYALASEVFYLLDAIALDGRKGEYYLTDIIEQAMGKSLKTVAYCMGHEDEFMGVNTPQELYHASRMLRKNIINALIKKGVKFLDADSVFIHPHASIGNGVTIYPNVFIEGETKIGKKATVYPNVRIISSSIGAGAVIRDSTLVEESVIGEGASVGPFAHIRPGSEVGRKAKIGNFVELKKAIIGNGTKASHLSYLGDVRIGRDVNIGAGTITCNYDGIKKNLTVIDDGVFVGSDSQLVAPVSVGKDAYIGAGSTITKDVPSGALALSRAGQKTIEGWVDRKKAREKRQKSG